LAGALPPETALILDHGPRIARASGQAAIDCSRADPEAARLAVIKARAGPADWAAADIDRWDRAEPARSDGRQAGHPAYNRITVMPRPPPIPTIEVMKPAPGPPPRKGQPGVTWATPGPPS